MDERCSGRLPAQPGPEELLREGRLEPNAKRTLGHGPTSASRAFSITPLFGKGAAGRRARDAARATPLRLPLHYHHVGEAWRHLYPARRIPFPRCKGAAMLL